MYQEKKVFKDCIIRKGNEKFKKGDIVDCEYINHIEEKKIVDKNTNEGKPYTKKVIKNVTDHKINGEKVEFLIYKPQKFIFIY